MGFGLGFPCCKGDDDPTFTVVLNSSPPLQFFAPTDRIFVSEFVRGTEVTDGGFEAGASFVSVFDARNFAGTSNLYGIFGHRWKNGVYQGDIPANGAVGVVDTNEPGVGNCYFPDANQHNQLMRQSFNANSPENPFSLFTSYNSSDLSTQRANDPGDSLYQFPQQAGDLGFGWTGGTQYGVHNDAWHAYDPRQDQLKDGVNYVQWMRMPKAQSGQKVRVKLFREDAEWHPCRQERPAPPASTLGDLGLFAAWGSFDTFVLPALNNLQSTAITYLFNQFNLSIPGITSVQPEVGFELEFATSGDFSETSAYLRPWVNGSTVPINNGVGHIFVTIRNAPMIIALLGALTSAPSDLDPLQTTTVDILGAGRLEIETIGGAGRERGRWAGFDVEYDNHETLTSILVNGRWTLRANRSAKIRPTSWGMQWPIVYTATDLPPGLNISNQGITGSPSETGSGVATVTAVDDNGVSVTSTYSWDVV